MIDMTLLDAEQQDKVAIAISEVEKTTDAELVAVLAKRSDSYHYIPLLWAALCALVTPAVLKFLPFWLEASGVYAIQLAVFVVVAALLSIPALSIRLIPKAVRFWRASNLARRQFLENNLHCTEGEVGVLIFVSEAERYVEIIADRGINQHVDPKTWETIVANFTEAVKRGETLQGFLDCIQRCGELLREHVPATAQKNELPNRLVVLN